MNRKFILLVLRKVSIFIEKIKNQLQRSLDAVMGALILVALEENQHIKHNMNRSTEEANKQGYTSKM